MQRVAAWLVVMAACGPAGGDHADARMDAVMIPATGVDLSLGSLDAFTYTVPQTIGKQSFTQIVDTGSTTMGVAAMSCSSCVVSPEYAPGSTASDQHVTASTMYADMSGWSGEVYQDKVSLSGLPTVGQEFVAITTQTSFFQGNMYQGILGFSPAANAEPNTNGFMDLEAAAGVPYEMAFRLCPTTGDMWIGGYDPSAGASAVQYTPMVPINATSNPFYSVQISDMAFGSNDLGFTTADFGITIVDTGTSVSEIPTPAETAMLNIVNTNSAFKSLFPSQTLADTMNGDCVTSSGVTPEMVDAMLPPLIISFPLANNSPFTIQIPPTKSYMAPAGNGQFCWGFTSSGSAAATDGSLIGDTTLAGMLAVFDVTNTQIGFAPEEGCAEAQIAQHPYIATPVSEGGARWFQQDPYYRPPPHRSTHAE